MTWRWYITIEAVRQLMQLAGLPGPLEEGNPDFVWAQDELGYHSLNARRVEGKHSRTGAEWRHHAKRQDNAT